MCAGLNLGWKAESFYYSGFTAENLKSVCEKFGLLRLPGDSKVLLVCDGGSENAGESDQFIMNFSDKIENVVAQVDRLYSNSMSESANKCMKYQFLSRRWDHMHSVADVRQALAKDISEFNDRPTRVLHTFTPNEVLGGLIPDENMYAKQIKAARTRRYHVNSRSGCGVC